MLTELGIRKLTAKGGQRVEIWDEKIPGFGLRVAPSGTKSFVIMSWIGDFAASLPGTDRSAGRPVAGCWNPKNAQASHFAGRRKPGAKSQRWRCQGAASRA